MRLNMPWLPKVSTGKVCRTKPDTIVVTLLLQYDFIWRLLQKKL
jgi:hypothetical protein